MFVLWERVYGLCGLGGYKMNEIKLKSCPFCGTEPYTSIDKLSADKIEASIQCNNPDCAALIKFKIKIKNGLLNFNEIIEGLKNAAEAWNRRIGE